MKLRLFRQLFSSETNAGQSGWAPGDGSVPAHGGETTQQVYHYFSDDQDGKVEAIQKDAEQMRDQSRPNDSDNDRNDNSSDRSDSSSGSNDTTWGSFWSDLRDLFGSSDDSRDHDSYSPPD